MKKNTVTAFTEFKRRVLKSVAKINSRCSLDPAAFKRTTFDCSRWRPVNEHHISSVNAKFEKRIK